MAGGVGGVAVQDAALLQSSPPPAGARCGNGLPRLNYNLTRSHLQPVVALGFKVVAVCHLLAAALLKKSGRFVWVMASASCSSKPGKAGGGERKGEVGL